MITAYGWLTVRSSRENYQVASSNEPLADHLLSSGAKVGAGTAVIVDGTEEGLQFSVVGAA